MAASETAREKDELRRAMREQLRTLTPEQHAAASAQIMRWLTASDVWTKQVGVVAMFGGLKSEPDLMPLLPWLRERGINVVFFAVEDDGMMTPYLVRSEQDLVIGAFGVLEPKRESSSRLGIADIDVVLVPGLAFSTSDGARLGRGKGYYDRVLSSKKCRARTIGVGMSLQMLQRVPREEHDICLHSLVSENGRHEFRAMPS